MNKHRKRAIAFFLALVVPGAIPAILSYIGIKKLLKLKKKKEKENK